MILYAIITLQNLEKDHFEQSADGSTKSMRLWFDKDFAIKNYNNEKKDYWDKSILLCEINSKNQDFQNIAPKEINNIIENAKKDGRMGICFIGCEIKSTMISDIIDFNNVFTSHDMINIKSLLVEG